MNWVPMKTAHDVRSNSPEPISLQGMGAEQMIKKEGSTGGFDRGKGSGVHSVNSSC